MNKKAIIVGGGFYGCQIALELAEQGYKVCLFEAENDLMQRASFVNQARVHKGYHYPRCLKTASSSRRNFDRFVKDFEECIDDKFTKYYAIARNFSKITSQQFINFCKAAQLPIKKANQNTLKLFNENLIELVFEVEEFAFNSEILKNIIKKKLQNFGVEYNLRTKVTKVSKLPNSNFYEVYFKNHLDQVNCIESHLVFNCAYASINTILPETLEPISLKHEIAIMPLIEVPFPLEKIGVTIMDGPFFSVMPFPAKKLHSLSHVRYTPKYSWVEGKDKKTRQDILEKMPTFPSVFRTMIQDASRYMPILKESIQKEELCEIKTILPKSELTDGRPILFLEPEGFKNYYVVLGSKIDNIYDLQDEIKNAVRYKIL